MQDYLQLDCVSKEFPGFLLDKISFRLPKGYIMGLIGPNGAGKTCTIKLILNTMEKDEGSIRVFGKDNISCEKVIKQELGVVYDSNFYVDTWTVRDVEKAVSGFYKDWDHQKFRDMLERFQIPSKKKVGEFSKGMQIKLMLASAFSHNAKLLILDEPTSGLDPAMRSELLEILQEYIEDGDKSVLFSTHITSELEKVADYIAYLNEGKMFYFGTVEGLKDKYKIIKGASGELTEELRKIILGLRETKIGFEGLIESKEARQWKGYLMESPSIEEIISLNHRRS